MARRHEDADCAFCIARDCDCECGVCAAARLRREVPATGEVPVDLLAAWCANELALCESAPLRAHAAPKAIWEAFAALLREREQQAAEIAKLKSDVAFVEVWADPPGLNGEPSTRARLRAELAQARQEATRASAELRHAYRVDTIDRGLVARAIRILEGITTPGAKP